MDAAAQIQFEGRATGATALAIFSPWGEPVGAGTEQAGLNAADFFHGILIGAGVECSPWSLLYTAQGSVVMLAVDNVGKSLAELWGAFSRFEIEAKAWIAQAQADGTWSDLFPVKDASRTLPLEIQLLPARIYALEAELKQLRQEQEQLGAEISAQLDCFGSGRTIDALTAKDVSPRGQWVGERLEAVAAELADWRRKLTGGES